MKANDVGLIRLMNQSECVHIYTSNMLLRIGMERVKLVIGEKLILLLTRSVL